jgi:Na+/proline symporter
VNVPDWTESARARLAAAGPQAILLLLWKRASYARCLAGMVTGFTAALLWRLRLGNQLAGIEVYNLPLAFVLALIVNLVVSVSLPSSGQPADAARQQAGPRVLEAHHESQG